MVRFAVSGKASAESLAAIRSTRVASILHEWVTAQPPDNGPALPRRIARICSMTADTNDNRPTPTHPRRLPFGIVSSNERETRSRALTPAWLPLVPFIVLFVILALNPNLAHPQDASVRTVASLNGDWQFRRDGQETWKTIRVPASFESHEGTDFDGIGWYRIQLPENMVLQDNQRAVVRFEASATETDVFCNGQPVGQHLGGWTPFECDISSQVRQRPPDTPIELTLRVDERVGHNSQGFLPVFAPHFGGIWQDVSLIIRSDVGIDDLKLFAHGDAGSQTLRVEIPIRATHPTTNRVTHVRVSSKRWDAKDPEAPWIWETTVPIENDCLKKLNESGSASQEVQLPVDMVLWSPADPALYVCRVDLLAQTTTSVAIVDRTRCRAAFRTITADGDRILLNGHPISVRGVLNWGYAPPDTAPSTAEAFWLQELDLVRRYGFNLMKFCLWVPPRRYLELADEQGVLTWMEYPTWHSRWSADQLPTLLREFREFFQYDRNHPSVILRSLTCETGPSADLDVLRTLYDECHRMIPGCLVEDDSSWIQWNRIHDFYDDHPYGNNHTWIPTIRRLTQYVQDHGAKPLVLGECIAADTWLDPSTLDPNRHGDNVAWLPKHLEANRRWMLDRRKDLGKEAVEALEQNSKWYALDMRKYQIETLRREAPNAGYVVSVIRDFPFAEMGLLDWNGNPKWQERDWDWHGDTMLLMETKNDRRSFFIDETLDVQFLISNYRLPDTPLPLIASKDAGSLHIELTNLSNDRPSRRREVTVPAETWMQPGNHPLVQLHESIRELVTLDDSEPSPIHIFASLNTPHGTTTNQWVIWVFPRKETHQRIRVHASCEASIRETIQGSPDNGETHYQETWVTQQFDLQLLERLERGADVLMIPNGAKHSFPQQQHWFLRGGPIVKKSKHFGPDAMWLRLQATDLGGPVVPHLQWLDQITPYVMLWDNHDIDHVRTHGLIFATQVGKGRLLVCSPQLFGETNAAGKWLLQQCFEAFGDPKLCTSSLRPETIQALRNQLTRKIINLTDRPWTFRTDPSNDGLAQGWQREPQPSDEWKPIRVGQHWEGQGYESLDGWAWYRIEMELPDDWKDTELFLWIDGGDDYYEVFANGQKVGSAGNIEDKKTAFEIQSSFKLTSVSSGSKLAIAIRVYDWQGAGGMFRPIALSTTDRDSSLEILK